MYLINLIFLIKLLYRMIYNYDGLQFLLIVNELIDVKKTTFITTFEKNM